MRHLGRLALDAATVLLDLDLRQFELGRRRILPGLLGLGDVDLGLFHARLANAHGDHEVVLVDLLGLLIGAARLGVFPDLLVDVALLHPHLLVGRVGGEVAVDEGQHLARVLDSADHAAHDLLLAGDVGAGHLRAEVGLAVGGLGGAGDHRLGRFPLAQQLRGQRVVGHRPFEFGHGLQRVLEGLAVLGFLEAVEIEVAEGEERLAVEHAGRAHLFEEEDGDLGHLLGASGDQLVRRLAGRGQRLEIGSLGHALHRGRHLFLQILGHARQADRAHAEQSGLAPLFLGAPLGRVDQQAVDLEVIRADFLALLAHLKGEVVVTLIEGLTCSDEVSAQVDHGVNIPVSAKSVSKR